MEYQSELTASNRWWSKKRAVHEDVWTVARRIEQDQSGRRARLKEFQNLYLDSWVGTSVADKNVVSFNMVRSVIDTAAAKISKNKPRIQILTNGGDAFLREKAEKLTQFLDGVFAEMNMHHKGQLVFRDACIFDGGVLRIFADPDSEQIKCERVLPHEILVDSLESYYGEPRQMFLKRAMHRDVVAALYPRKAAWIKDAPVSRMEMMSGVRETGSMIDVIESWHLPSKEGGKDGRHVICLENATLFDEEYTHATFPFVFFRWQDPITGFWMPGLAQELWGLQAELNTHLDNIRVAHKRMGRPGAFMSDSCKIDDQEMSNEIGLILRGGMDPPQFFTTPVMAPQVYQWTESLRELGYNQTGASQASAGGMKPKGDLSGVALRQVEDIETERWVLAGQRYERMFREIAEHVIRLARELYEDGVDLTIKARDREFLESIKWSDVDMEDDTFGISIFETSGLPQRPEGRIQTAIDLSQAGIMSPETAGEILIGIPDLKSAMSIERAPRENIDRMLDRMVREDVQLSPLPYMNLELARTRTTLKLNWCDVEGVGEDAKQRLLTFLEQIQDMLSAAAPPPPPEPMPPPMADPSMVPPTPGQPPLPGVDVPPPVDPQTMAATMALPPPMG